MGVRVSVNGHMCPNNRRDIDIFRKYLKKMMARDEFKLFMGVGVSVNGHMCPNNRRDIDIFRKYLKQMMAHDE